MPGMMQPKREIIFHLDTGMATVKVWPIVPGKEASTKIMRLTPEQYDTWQSGAYIQDALPHLNNEEREFLISGLDQQAWDEMFKDN